jgi:flagellar hook assembly protein FlgD
VGQRIRLVNSHVQGPGQAIATWDGRNDQGQAMVSGMYFYQVTASALENNESNQHIQFQETKKMLLVK